VVFVPLGFATETVEHLPQWAAKGRTRLGVQVSNARVTGHYVVKKGQRDLGNRVARLRPPRRAKPAGTGTRSAEALGADAPIDDLPGMPPVPGTGTVSLPSDRATSAAAAAAIEGYDTLSASQVVRRLDGLGPEELRAVYRHEAATRGRRTILHRVQQLLHPDPSVTNGTADGATTGAGPAETT
jgi:hypothetical protein